MPTTTKNNGNHCDKCGIHWEETDSLTKVGRRWFCDQCECPSVLARHRLDAAHRKELAELIIYAQRGY